MQNFDAKSPFKLLDSYDEYDTESFFGREQEIDEIYNKLYESNLLLVYGVSGTGKTSLIKCGLNDRFRDIDWLPIYIRRGKNINQSLNHALEEASITPFDETSSLEEKVQSLFWDYYKKIFLIFDQFEELFLVDKAEEESRVFFNSIVNLLNAGTDFKIILVVREEFLAHLTPFEDTIQTLFENRIRVEYMRRARIRNVIQQTLMYHQIKLETPEQESVELILKKLESRRTGTVELSYLQVYLDRLWWRLKQQTPDLGQDNEVLFTRELIEELDFDDVMEDFLKEQIGIVESELKTLYGDNYKGISKGLPLKILYTLITKDNTKRMLSFEDIKTNLQADISESHTLTNEEVEYCLNRFVNMRILKSLDFLDN